MKMILTRSLLLAGVVSLLALSPLHARKVGSGSPQDFVVEPPECLETPPGAAKFVISGTLTIDQPVQSGDPGFPAASCNSLAAAWAPVGPVRNYVTAKATVTDALVGTALLHANACLFSPPPTVVADLSITSDDGDILNLRVKLTGTPDSPPAPNREASGTRIVTGGTGRFVGATGEFNVSAKSHGTVHAGTNVAMFRDIAMCGYVHLRQSGSGRPWSDV